MSNINLTQLLPFLANKITHQLVGTKQGDTAEPYVDGVLTLTVPGYTGLTNADGTPQTVQVTAAQLQAAVHATVTQLAPHWQNALDDAITAAGTKQGIPDDELKLLRVAINGEFAALLAKV